MKAYRVLVLDQTDQRRHELTVNGEMTWSEVAVQAVDRLGLPPHYDRDGEPIIYKLYDDVTSQVLLPEETATQAIEALEEELRERFQQAERPAEEPRVVRLLPEMQPAAG